MKKLYNVKEVAKLLGFSTNTVYKYLDEGKIKATRLGKEGRFRIPTEEMNRLLQENGISQPSDQTSPITQKLTSSVPMFMKEGNAPSIFDWMIFILSIALGASQFLFPTYVLDVSFEKYALVIKILKACILVSGSFLILDDAFGSKNRSFHGHIHTVLAVLFTAISLIFLKTSYYPQLIGYSTVAISLIILKLWPVNEYVKYLTLLNINLFLFGVIAIFSPASNGLDFISIWFDQNKWIFVAVWLVTTIFFAWFCLQAVKGKKFFIFAIAAGVCIVALSYSIYAFSFGYWERAVYLVILSSFSLLFPFWRVFSEFIDESRSQLLLAFFWLVALFAIGGITLYFIGKSFEVYVLSELEKRLETSSEIVQSFVTNAQDKIITFSQDRQLIQVIENDQMESEEALEILRDLFLTEKGTFRRIVLTNTDGINVNLYPELEYGLGVDISQIDNFKNVKDGQRLYTSGVLKPRTPGVAPAVFISSPIYSENGTFLGVLGGSLDLVELEKRVNLVQFGKKGSFNLVDDKYEYVIHPNADKVLTKVADDSAGGLAVKGEKGHKKAYNSENILSLQAYKPMPVLGWGIVAQEPLSDIFGEYSTVGFIIFIILAMSGVGSLILIIKSKKSK